MPDIPNRALNRKDEDVGLQIRDSLDHFHEDVVTSPRNQ